MHAAMAVNGHDGTARRFRIGKEWRGRQRLGINVNGGTIGKQEGRRQAADTATVAGAGEDLW
jgi:hypothetical protein